MVIVIDGGDLAHQHIAKAVFAPEAVIQPRRQADALSWRQAQLAARRMRL